MHETVKYGRNVFKCYYFVPSSSGLVTLAIRSSKVNCRCFSALGSAIDWFNFMDETIDFRVMTRGVRSSIHGILIKSN